MPLTAQLGVDPKQLRLLVIRPALKDLALWSPTAENLVLGTGLHESHLKYLHQLGAGPAHGLFQMEPFTHDDIWRHFLSGTPLGTRVLCMTSKLFDGQRPSAEELVWNLKYAAAMCRVFYRRVLAPLPANEPEPLARYWKQYYNTVKGKGTVEQALPAFELAVSTYTEDA